MGRYPRQDYDTQQLVNVAAWVHEYTHFIQFATRLQSIEYLSYADSLSTFTLKTVKEFYTAFRSIEPFLPLHQYLFDNFDSMDQWPPILHEWMDYWIAASVPLSIGGWAPRPVQHETILELLREKYPEDIHPKFLIAAEGAEHQEVEITTERVLEAEAFLSSMLFLRGFFPERAQEVLQCLYPSFDNNIIFGLLLLEQGMEELVPFISDYSFQTHSHIDTKKKESSTSSYQQYHPAWRFINSIQLLSGYAGIKFNEVEKYSAEVAKKLESEIGPANTEHEIIAMSEQLATGKHPVFRGPEAKLIAHNLGVRAKQPNWFRETVLYWGPISGSLCLPFVKPRHSGVSEGDAYVAWFGMGATALKPDEKAFLIGGIYHRWAGLELAKSKGKLVCPVCRYDYHYLEGNCSMNCHFSAIAKNAIGFHPLEHWIQ